MTSHKWMRTPGSKWHKVGYEGPYENKYARNPLWKRGGEWGDPDNPYFITRIEDRIIAACGTINSPPDRVKVIEGNPMMQNGKRKRARICGNCVVYLGFDGGTS